MVRPTRVFMILILLASFFLQSFALSPASPPPPPIGSFPPAAKENPATNLAGAAWYDGAIQYSTIINCPSLIQGFPYQENGVGTFVGFLANPDGVPSEPYPFEVYYVHIYIAGLGYPCSGTRLVPEIVPPANTSLAIDAAHPVYCFYDGKQTTPGECPQTLPPSTINSGAFWLPSIDNAHANSWPLPQGHNLEFQIPVVSSKALTNSPFSANIWAMDGNSSPWLHPQQGAFVFWRATSFVYPSPSTDSITSTSAVSHVNLYTYGLTGNGYFDLGTDTNYSLTHDPFSITENQESWAVYTDWKPFTLTPGTLYHFRVRFLGSNGVEYVGGDQTFTTLPANAAGNKIYLPLLKH